MEANYLLTELVGKRVSIELPGIEIKDAIVLDSMGHLLKVRSKLGNLVVVNTLTMLDIVVAEDQG